MPSISDYSHIVEQSSLLPRINALGPLEKKKAPFLSPTGNLPRYQLLPNLKKKVEHQKYTMNLTHQESVQQLDKDYNSNSNSSFMQLKPLDLENAKEANEASNAANAAMNDPTAELNS